MAGGVLICGTGVGISPAANKVHGIRACVCSEPYTARLSKQHNNSNIIDFGTRVIGIETAKMIVDERLVAQYEGGTTQADRFNAFYSRGKPLCGRCCDFFGPDYG